MASGMDFSSANPLLPNTPKGTSGSSRDLVMFEAVLLSNWNWFLKNSQNLVMQIVLFLGK